MTDTNTLFPPVTDNVQRAREVEHALVTLPTLQCMNAMRGIENLPALQTFCKIVYANVAVATGTTNRDLARACEAEALRFFDTALSQRYDTINVVVGGPESGKMTKLRALVQMLHGSARFVTGKLFREELRAQANIVLRSRDRSIVVFVGRDIPPQNYDDDHVSLEMCSGSQREILGGGGNPASIALAIDDESDLVRLASLGLRLNVLRLGDEEFHPPAAASDAFVDADNAAVYSLWGNHCLPTYISHTDMRPLLCAGGALFAAWRAHACAQRALRDIQDRFMTECRPH